MNKIFVYFLILCICSCVKDGTTTSYLILKNSTLHSIDIRPYKMGIEDTSQLIHLASNTENQIELNRTRGKSTAPLVFFDYFKNVDSVTITWDNLYPVTHMISDNFISSNKNIAVLAQRNIGYRKSYSESVLSENKQSISWNVVYNFNEQDYLDAK